MIRRIQEMILDAQEQTFFSGIPRETVIYTVEKKSNSHHRDTPLRKINFPSKMK